MQENPKPLQKRHAHGVDAWESIATSINTMVAQMLPRAASQQQKTSNRTLLSRRLTMGVPTSILNNIVQIALAIWSGMLSQTARLEKRNGTNAVEMR